MTDRNSWNMARIASARPLPKPFKMNTSIVGSFYRRFPAVYGDNACKACGYHVCSCKPVATVAQEPSRRVGSRDVPTCCFVEGHDVGCQNKQRPFFKYLDRVPEERSLADELSGSTRPITQAQVDANIGSAFTCCGNSSYAEHSTGCRFHPANVPITKDKTWGKTRGTVATATAAAQAIGPAPAGLYSKRALECVAPKSVNRDRIGCDECGGLRIHAIGCKREPAQYNGY